MNAIKLLAICTIAFGICLIGFGMYLAICTTASWFILPSFAGGFLIGEGCRGLRL